MNQLEQLRQKIDEAADSYYNKGVSIVTDDVFDTVLNMLQRLDHKDPRLSGVGSEPTLDKVEHEFPMGSLDNIDANKPKELESYVKRNRGHVLTDSLYHITPKIDGSSLALTYESGKLVRVLTRGNGAVGQDITAKARFFKNVPTTLSRKINITVRGEAVMHREDFLEYIKSAELEGVRNPRNPRNTGNGLIVRKDSYGAGLIHFYAFDCFVQCMEFPGVSGMYDIMTGLGFTCPDYQVVAEDGISQQIDTMVGRDYPFDIDGLVIKVNDFAQQDLINEGCDKLRLRSNQAVKFNSKKAETIVTGVTVTVGSTGKITPTLTVEPVEIGGIVNSNVLVYNYDEVERLKIGVGDKVQIVLAGDIIPRILKVVDKSPQLYNCKNCGFVGTKHAQELHHNLIKEST
jgi:DNA ligase (NAD+)